MCVKRQFSPQTLPEEHWICPREGAMRTVCQDCPRDSQKRMRHQEKLTP